MPTKTRIPQDFQVEDEVRQYCVEKWNFLYLPDVFLEDFIEVFQTNERRHINWNTTFKTFIRRASPSGQFYSDKYWSAKCEQARRHKALGARDGVTTKQPASTNDDSIQNNAPPSRSTWIPTPVAKETLKHIRELLKTQGKSA